MCLYKKYLTYDHIFWVWTKFEKHIQIFRHWINFYMIYSSNKHSDGQTNFKMPAGSKIKNWTTMKTKTFIMKKKKNEIRNTCSKVMFEHPLIYIIYIYKCIYTSSNSITFPSLKSVKNWGDRRGSSAPPTPICLNFKIWINCLW